MSDLNHNQEQFCREYIKDGNATQAYLRVPGYTPKSEKIAAVSALRLLQQPKIRKRISQLRSEIGISATIAASEQIEPNDIIREWIDIGFANIIDYFELRENKLCLRDLTKMDRSKTRAIQKIRVVQSESSKGSREEITLELCNRETILDRLAAQLGMDGDLNKAFAILRRYDYEVIEVEDGYKIIDLQQQDKDQLVAYSDDPIETIAIAPEIEERPE